MKTYFLVALLLITTLPTIKTSSQETTQGIFYDEIISTALAADFSPDQSPAKIQVTITAYSSTHDQTDETPFIAASGKLVRDGIVAANFLKFGTRIKIPEIFGDKIFVVEDRMASRFYHRVDIWFSSREAALKFGKQKTEIEILES
jgi:3D (Asp-Asp-Asp) domain-containing protein